MLAVLAIALSFSSGAFAMEEGAYQEKSSGTYSTLEPQAQAATLTIDEQRTEIQKTKTDTLAQLYKAKPKAETEVKGAYGYAVFESGDLAALFVSGTYGHGIAHDNNTGQETYMKMASGGVGAGLGARNFRTIFTFDTENAYKQFTTNGLDLSGHVDLAVKGSNVGGVMTAAADVRSGVHVYQMTQNGLLAQVMLHGSRYWNDEALNTHAKSSDARDINP